MIDEIISYGMEVGLFNELVNKSELKKIFESRLDESEFVESLINTIIVRTKQVKHLNKKKAKEILIELDKLRLEIEYR